MGQVVQVCSSKDNNRVIKDQNGNIIEKGSGSKKEWKKKGSAKLKNIQKPRSSSNNNRGSYTPHDTFGTFTDYKETNDVNDRVEISNGDSNEEET